MLELWSVCDGREWVEEGSVCVLCVCARGIEGDGGISVPLGSYAGLGIGH